MPISTTGSHSANGLRELETLLDTSSNWDFDVILLEQITGKRPLVWVGMRIFSKFRVAEFLNTDETTLRNWLMLIEANYHSSNPYHNSTHAADVLQAMAYFLSKERLRQFLGPLDEVTSLLAAVVHDVDHPGKTSQYLTNTGHALSVLYNKVSILESHHVACAFKLSLSDPRVNIFKNLNPETCAEVQNGIIDMILATDMSKHAEHLAKFTNAFQPIFRTKANESLTRGDPALATPENKMLIKRMLIKCADVSNPVRPMRTCIVWANRICEEYFQQTEDEIGRGLPPTMAMFDRKTCSMPKSQMGFVDYFLSTMFSAWDGFLGAPELIGHLKANYEFWKDLERQGLTSVEQVNDYVRQMKD